MTSITAAPVAPPEEPSIGRGPAILQPLRERDFRLVFLGQSVSLIGDYFHFVALAWLALQLTGSGLALGTVLMVAAIPRAVFMLLGGAMSDRFSPRSLMLVSNALRAVVVGIVAALVLTERVELWHLYILAAIFGVVDAFFHPAVNTIVPMLVRDRLLPAANALMQIVQQLAGLIGPAIAGVLVAAVQTGPAFAIDATSFAVAAATLLLVRRGGRPPGEAPASHAQERLLGTIRSGVSYAWRDPAVRALLLLVAALNFAFSGPILVGLPYLADQRFDGGSALFGIMVSAYGAGALAGALLAGSIHVARVGLVTLLVAIGLGFGMALIGLSSSVGLTLAAMLAIGVGTGFVNVRIVSWLQERTPEALRGRVMSLVLLGAVGLNPLSLAVAGAIIDLGAATLMFAVAGGIILAAAVAGLAWGVPARMDAEPA